MKEQSLSLPVWSARFLSMQECFRTGICQVIPKCKTKITRMCCRARSVPLGRMVCLSVVGVYALTIMDWIGVDIHRWWGNVVAAVTAVSSTTVFLRILIPLYRKEGRLWKE